MLEEAGRASQKVKVREISFGRLFQIFATNTKKPKKKKNKGGIHLRETREWGTKAKFEQEDHQKKTLLKYQNN